MIRPIAVVSLSFIGIKPATFTLDGVEMAPMSDHAAAAALLAALPRPPPDRRATERAPAGVPAPAATALSLPLAGSRAGDWPAARRRQLAALIGLWVGIMPPAAAQRWLAEIGKYA